MHKQVFVQGQPTFPICHRSGLLATECMLWKHNTRLMIEIGRERKEGKTRLYIVHMNIAQPTVNVEDSRRRREGRKTNITIETCNMLHVVFFALCKSLSEERRNRSLEAITKKKQASSVKEKMEIFFSNFQSIRLLHQHQNRHLSDRITVDSNLKNNNH